MGTQPIHPNQELALLLPSSEVCMHLRVAGTRMRARLQPNGMVQLLGADGRRFSFPITAAEAGLDHDHDGWFSVMAAPPDPLADQVDRLADQPSADPPAGPAEPLSWHPTCGGLSVPEPDPDQSL